MSVQDKIVKQAVYVAHNDVADCQRVIDLRLESGSTAKIAFRRIPPNDWHHHPHSAIGVIRQRGEDVP